MTVFGSAYANQYDELSRDKNYRAECELVERIFRQHGDAQIHRVIDFGCGTGSHSILLAQRGYSVTGVDLSESMLNLARQKSARAGVDITWMHGDARQARAGEDFDAALFMFAVFGYMLSNIDMMSALANARRQVRRGGLLIFDVWYGPAVLSIRPSDRVKILTIPGGQVIRTVNSQLDVRHHTCKVNYHLWRLAGNHVESESEESHLVRYFFPLELELLLSQSGFSLVSLTSFPELERPADETTWNVLGVARAI